MTDFGRETAVSVVAAGGLLADLNAAGVLHAADVHVARRCAALVGEERPEALLAAALAVRAVRQGSVCVDLATVAERAVRAPAAEPAAEPGGQADVGADVGAGAELPEVDWPEPGAWTELVADSPLVAEQVLRLEGGRVYLDRYWREETQVCADLVERVHRLPPELDVEVLTTGLDRVFPAAGYQEQRDAVRAAASRWLTVVTGGPGAGKTTAVAGLLALLAEQHERAHGRAPRIALCAPTGKAAARLQEAVDEAAARLADPRDRARLDGLRASTMHRLLGWLPTSNVRFRHDRHNRLPYDVVVVDEASMVSLTMMARLLEALRPQARLLLVGDADQLSSVEAGAVLADLVAGFGDGPASPVVRLGGQHRFHAGIGALAEALRAGDADAAVAVLGQGRDDVSWIDPADADGVAAFERGAADVAVELRRAAEAGAPADALDVLDRHRLLCAHRRGPYGVAGWNRLVERLVAERTGVVGYDEWYAGRPVLITANDRGLRLNNGDTGVACRTGDGRLRVYLRDGAGVRDLAPTRLADVETVHAMTIHKAQGSQAAAVSVVLPPEDSPLLTRELFYTAVTRAQDVVRVLGGEPAVRAAIGREVQRASGLRERLRAALAAT